MLILRTSSAVSSICCRAVSIMRFAIGVARFTASCDPEIVSVSPRRATLAPLCFESSMRFSSFTPARVSMSAPSVDRRWTIGSSVSCGRAQLQVQVLEILRLHRSRRALEQGARRGCFGKSNHVAKRWRAGKQHRNSVEAERDATMRWRAGAQRLEQEAEPNARFGFVDAQQCKDTALHPLVMNANASAAELGTVHDDIICECANCPRLRIEHCDVIRVRSCERMMHCCKLSRPGVEAEKRKVSDPQKLDLAFAYKLHSSRNLLTRTVERHARDIVAGGYHEAQLTFFEPEHFGAGFAHELGGRAVEHTVRLPDSKQAGGTT